MLEQNSTAFNKTVKRVFLQKKLKIFILEDVAQKGFCIVKRNSPLIRRMLESFCINFTTKTTFYSQVSN